MIQHNHEWLSYDDDEEAERPNVMKSIAESTAQTE